MKFVVVIPDGCGDHALAELGGRTPMQAARMPHLDALASRGIVGRVSHCPDSLAPGSDACNLSLLGSDPRRVYSGRAPLEAAALGITLGDNDWALRCNTVTIENGVMVSFSAGNFSTPDATAILSDIAESLAAVSGESLEFFPSVGYRNLMIWRERVAVNVAVDLVTVPPHDIIGQPVEPFLPRGAGSDILRLLFDETGRLLASHPVNAARVASGQLPCTHLWFWAQGQRPRLPSFADEYRACGVQRGAMIAAVDLLRGIARLRGWETLHVSGATGDIHTDYAAKGRAAAKAIDDYDIVCVHIEAPDEASHDGSVADKVDSLEKIDALTLPPILEKLAEQDSWRILVCPDHLTPIATRTHARGMIPWLVAGSDITQLAPPLTTFDEVAAAASPLQLSEGHRLMGWFLSSQPSVTSFPQP